MRNEKNQTWKERSRVHRYLCLFLVAVLVTTQCTQDWGVSLVTARATCPNHQAHDDSCSYAEETRVVQACNHAEKCDETCASRVLNCTHTHDDSCTIVDSEGELQCTHSHTEDCYECMHEHDAECGYKEETVVVAECDHTCGSCASADVTESVAEYEDETTVEPIEIENNVSEETRSDAKTTRAALVNTNTEGKEETEENLVESYEAIGNVEINSTNFPDSYFEDHVKTYFDTDKDGYLSADEIATVKVIDLCGARYADLNSDATVVEHWCENTTCTSVQGIEFFPNLEELYCSAKYGNSVTFSGIDVSKNTKLKLLDIAGCRLKTLDVSFNTELKELNCSENKLTELDLDNNTKLEKLSGFSNLLKEIDLSNCPNLNFLDVTDCKLTQINVQYNTKLSDFRCGANRLTKLDVRNNPSLTYISCNDNELTELDVTNNRLLTGLVCSANHLTYLDLTGLNITGLFAGSGQKVNALSMYADESGTGYINTAKNLLDTVVMFAQGTTFSEAVQVGAVYTSGNALGTGYAIDANGVWTVKKGLSNPGNIYFRADGMGSVGTTTCVLSGVFTYEIPELAVSNGYLDVNDAKDLTGKNAQTIQGIFRGCFGEISDVRANTVTISCEKLADVKKGILGKYPVTITYEADDGTTLTRESVLEVGLDIDAQDSDGNYLNFPDVEFQNWITGSTDGAANIPGAEDGFLTKAELDAVTSIDLGGRSDATGTAPASSHSCTDLAGIEYFSNLEYLNANWGTLRSLDVSHNTKLKELWAVANDLLSFNVTGCTQLTKLLINANRNLGSVDLSGLTELIYLDVDGCGLTALDITEQKKLDGLCAHSNYKMKSIKMSEHTGILRMDLRYCQIVTLDMQAVPNLNTISGNGQDLGKLSMYYDDDTAAWVNTAKNSLDAAYQFDADHTTFYKTDTDNSGNVIAGAALDPSKFGVDENGCFTVASGAANPGKIYFVTSLVSANASNLELSGTFTYETSDLEVSDGYIDVNEAKTLTFATDLLPYFNYKARSSYTVTCAEFAKIQSGTLGRYSVTVTYNGDDGKVISRNSILEVGVEIDAQDANGSYRNFPDDYFRNWITANVSGADDGFLTLAELNAVTEIDFGATNEQKHTCTGLTGLSYFSNLKILNVSYGEGTLKTANLSDNTQLEKVYIYVNYLESLDVSSCKKLLRLKAQANPNLKTIDVRELTELRELDVDSCGLTTIDLSNNVKLTDLCIHSNSLTKLDVSKNPELGYFDCHTNNLKELDLSNHSKIYALSCYDNELTELEVSHLTELREIGVGINHLAKLDLTGINLENFYYKGDQTLGCLSLYLNGTGDAYVNSVHRSADAEAVFAEGTKFYKAVQAADGTYSAGDELGTDYGLDENGKWTVAPWAQNPGVVYFYNDQLGNTGRRAFLSGTFTYTTSDIIVSDGWIDVSDAKKLTDQSELLSRFTISTLETGSPVITCDDFTDVLAGTVGQYQVTVTCGTKSQTAVLEVGVEIEKKDSSGNYLHFTDAYFRNYVSENFDTKADGFLTKAELDAAEKIDIQGTSTDKVQIKNLDGIRYLSKLKKVKVVFGQLEEVDLSYNTALESIDLGENKDLRTLHVKNLTNVEKFSISCCPKLALQWSDLLDDLNRMTKLTSLNVFSLQIDQLDCTLFPQLEELYVHENKFTELDLSRNQKLKILYCGKNQLTELDLTNNRLLTNLVCDGNALTELKVDHLTALTDLDCANNHLTSLDISSLTNLTTVDAAGQTVEKDLAMTYDSSENAKKWVNTASATLEPVRSFYYHASNPTLFYKGSASGASLSNFTVATDGTLNASSVFPKVDKVYFKSAPVDGNGKAWTNSLNGTFTYAPQYTLSAGPVVFTATSIKTTLTGATDASNVTALAAVQGVIGSNPDLSEIKNAATVSMDASTLAALQAGTVGTYRYKVTLGDATATGQIDVLEDDAIGTNSLVVIPATIRLFRDYDENIAVAQASVKLYANMDTYTQGKTAEVTTAADFDLAMGLSTTEKFNVQVYKVDASGNESQYQGTDALAKLNQKTLEQKFKLKSTNVSGLKYGEYAGTMNFTIKYAE